MSTSKNICSHNLISYYINIDVILCHQSVNARFYPYSEIETDAVFNLDEDVLLTTDEVCSSGFIWMIILFIYSQTCLKQFVVFVFPSLLPFFQTKFQKSQFCGA